MASPTDAVDGQVNDSFDQAYYQNVAANLKILMDNYMSHLDSRERENDRLIGVRGTRSEDLQAKINDQFLGVAAANASLANTMAQNNTVVANRIASNAVGMDAMVLGGLMTRPDELAETVIGKAQADTASDVAQSVIRAAGANAAITTPVAQGTTGVAQGSLQTQTPILQAAELANMVQVNHALSVELAEIVKALAVIVVKDVDVE